MPGILANPPLTRSPRLYCADPLPAGGVFVLPEATAHHAANVLRLREGDAVTLFDGRGGEHAAVLSGVGRSRVEATLGGFTDRERESIVPVRLLQCLQGADRMDYTIEKAVELGVREIIPVQSLRSVVRLDGERAAKRVRHWRQVVIAASEQCGRNRLATVGEVERLDRALVQAPGEGVVRLHLDPGAATTVASLARPSAVELLVGPEGGLAPEEVRMAEIAGFRGLRLGPRVLRTETAALVMLAALHARWGDFL